MCRESLAVNSRDSDNIKNLRKKALLLDFLTEVPSFVVKSGYIQMSKGWTKDWTKDWMRVIVIGVNTNTFGDHII